MPDVPRPTAGEDPSALARRVVERVQGLLRVDGASLYWFDDDERVLAPVAVVDRLGLRAAPVRHPGQGLVGEVFRRGEAIVAPAAQAHPAARSLLGVPLRSPDAVCGVLVAHDRHPGRLDHEAAARVEPLAAEAAAKLHDVRHLVRERHRAVEAQGLAELMRMGAHERDVGRMLDAIAEQTWTLLGADVVGIVVRDDPTGMTSWRGIHGNRTDAWSRMSDRPATPAERRLTARRGPVVLQRLGANPEWPLEQLPLWRAEGVRTGLSVPLRVSGETIAGLEVGWRFDLEPAPATVDLAVTLSSYAATLVESRRTSRALQERDRALRTVLANAPVVLGSIDSQGRLTMIEGRLAAGAVRIPEDGPAPTVEEAFGQTPALVANIRAALDGDVEPEIVPVGDRLYEVTHTPLPEGGLVSVGTNVTFRERARAALEHQVSHDVLTGLPNRTTFRDRLDDLLRRAAPVAVILVDLRAFRDVNESLGHDAGDALLREVAQRYVALTTDEALVSRLAADVFAVACPASRETEAVTRARALLGALEAPFLLAGGAIHVTARAGIARGADDAEALLSRADVALTSARRRRRDIAVYDEAMEALRRDRVGLTADLREALETDGLSLVFQPIVAVDTGRPVHAEALTRWNHPRRGRVPPVDFVPVAERSGLVTRMTAWVVDRAVAECVAWREREPELGVAVNVSAIDLADPVFPLLVESVLERRGLPPDALCVELTESTVMDEPERAIAALGELAGLGVTVAIDDFGTGYSSLSYLQRLPAHQLKIDRAFIMGLDGSSADEAIVRSAIGLGHSLGLAVVAEGVETTDGYRRLRDLDCDLAQGYCLAAPLPVGDLLDWAATRPSTDGV